MLRNGDARDGLQLSGCVSADRRRLLSGSTESSEAVACLRGRYGFARRSHGRQGRGHTKARSFRTGLNQGYSIVVPGLFVFESSFRFNLWVSSSVKALGSLSLWELYLKGCLRHPASSLCIHGRKWKLLIRLSFYGSFFSQRPSGYPPGSSFMHATDWFCLTSIRLYPISSAP